MNKNKRINIEELKNDTTENIYKLYLDANKKFVNFSDNDLLNLFNEHKKDIINFYIDKYIPLLQEQLNSANNLNEIFICLLQRNINDYDALKDIELFKDQLKNLLESKLND